MQCPSCKARIGDTSNFCRYCGSRVFKRPTAAVSTEPASAYGAAAAVAPRKDTEITMTLNPGFYPIPKRFELQLNSGTKPQEVIGELLRQKAEMRNLLAQIAASGEGSTRGASAARVFLLSHCIVCGDSVQTQQAGKTPVCKQCASLP